MTRVLLRIVSSLSICFAGVASLLLASFTVGVIGVVFGILLIGIAAWQGARGTLPFFRRTAAHAMALLDGERAYARSLATEVAGK